MSPASSLEDGVVGPHRPLLNLFVILWCAPFAAWTGWLLFHQPLELSVATAGLALMLLVSAGGMIGALWQLIDRRPLARLDADGMRLHPTIGPALIRWENISGASYDSRRYGRPARTTHFVAINLFDPQWRWRPPFRSMFVNVDFGPHKEMAEAYAEMIAERIGRGVVR